MQNFMHPGFLIFTVPYQTECAWLLYLMQLSTNPQATFIGRGMRALLFAEADLVAWAMRPWFTVLVDRLFDVACSDLSLGD